MTSNTTLQPAVGAQVERGVRPLCSSCRFPLDEYAAGQRYFGFHTAHAEWYCIQRLCNEVDRLTAALKKANDQAESFERAWYLRGDDQERALALLARYRDETPLGHQPHMIALEADHVLGRAT